jgi:hypothetical protein
MSDDASWGSSPKLLYGALAAGAVAVAGLGAWYLHGKRDVPVAGEDLVPEAVRSLWRWHAWNGEVHKDVFAAMMKEPLQEFCKVQLLALLKVRDC